MSAPRINETIIRPKSPLQIINFRELWRYRDLLMIFVRRDLVSLYKQTILGPLWLIIQPLLTTVIFTIVFSRIAQLSTSGIHPMLFYMSGVVPWAYFANCINKTSDTFHVNIAIFGKVYFPRIVVPLSVVISNGISFIMQFIILIGFMFYFQGYQNITMSYQAFLLLPLLFIIMALLGLSLGIMISALTIRYRDLKFLVGFGVQLLMYASPVIFPLSSVKGKMEWVLLANPMTPVIESFRHVLFGTGELRLDYIMYSVIFTLITLVLGLFLFSRVEKKFADTV
ncbi:MAG: ABC transporter permease [Flavobacteriales bacterium]